MSEVMRDKVFHLKHVFQCLEKKKYFILLVHVTLFIQHYRYIVVSTVCLACYSLFLGKNVSDVMQDKEHSTANSPTFEIMYPGSHAYKSRSKKS